LKPFEQAETRAYIQHRLAVVGAKRSVFTEQASRYIHLAAGGVPRLINVIADNTLLEMFFERHTSASDELLSRVCADLGLDLPANEALLEKAIDNDDELGFCPDEIAANIANEPVAASLARSLVLGSSTKDIEDPLAFLGPSGDAKDTTA